MGAEMIQRQLELPDPGTETFFLWGPRQTGKSTLLKTKYPASFWVDVLKAEEYRRYLSHPEWLRGELIQKDRVPDMEIAISLPRARNLCVPCALAPPCEGRHMRMSNPEYIGTPDISGARQSRMQGGRSRFSGGAIHLEDFFPIILQM